MTVFALVLAILVVVIESSNVCFPKLEKRAFVTTLGDSHDNLLKIQVLHRSLRMNQAKEDIVVIVKERTLTAKPELSKQLSSFGFKIYPITNKMLDVHSAPPCLSIWAFGLVQYERVVYLDPYSLVLENVDELFACAGFCASLHSKGSPAVIEPSLKMFATLSQYFPKSKSQVISSIHTMMNIESCPSFLQEVAVNAETRDECFNRDSQLLLTECHQLPAEYGVLSGEFAAQDMHKDLLCTSCGFESPKIVMYPNIENTYESFMKTRKAIVSKWDSVRGTIPISSEMKLESFVSFAVGAIVSFIVLYCRDLNTQCADNLPEEDFLISPLPSMSKSSYLSGVSLMWDSLSCAASPRRSVTASSHMTANRSSIYLFTALLSISFATSIWYHLSLTIGQYSSDFEWDPLSSLVVGYSWSTLLLLIGLQLIDYSSELLTKDRTKLLLQVLFIFASYVVIVTCFNWRRYFVYIQAYVCLVAVSLSIYQRDYSPAKSTLVQNADISVMLGSSLIYCFISYALTLLNVSIVLRTVIIRSLGMLHYFSFLYVVISVTCGEYLSDIIRKATLRRSSDLGASFIFQTCSCYTSRLCCALKKLFFRPAGIFLASLFVLAIFFYVKLFLARGSKLPSTSPYVCLRQRGKYLNADGGVSSGCGAREAFEVVSPQNTVYSETFSQNFVCMRNKEPVLFEKRRHRVKKFNNRPFNFIINRNDSWWETIFLRGLTSRREEKSKYLHNFVSRNAEKTCGPATQFVMILPPEKERKLQYCLYNAHSGNFVTSLGGERKFCGQTEKWEVLSTHQYIYILNKLSYILYPLKYNFVYFNSFSSMCLMALLVGVTRKIENYPYLKVSLYCMVSVLFLHLFHVVAIWLIWGANFKNMRQYNTDALHSFQRALGVLTGPQYFRTISMLPDECPETLWFTALIFFSSSLPVFLVLLSCIQKRKLSVVETEFLHYSHDSKDDFDDAETKVQSEKDLNFNVSIMSRVASCAIGSLLLETLLSLVLPVQYIASGYTSKSSCSNFEDRFGIMSFDAEYVDTVVLYVNVIFLMGIKYSTSPVFFAFSIIFTIILYVLVWLTVECSYFLFISKFCITIVAWITISHKLSSYFEFLILKTSKLHFGKLNRNQSMPNFSQNVQKIDDSPTFHRQLSRQSSTFSIE